MARLSILDPGMKGFGKSFFWPQFRELYAQAQKVGSGEVHPSETPMGSVMLKDIGRSQALNRQTLIDTLSRGGISGPMLASIARNYGRGATEGTGNVWNTMRAQYDPTKLASYGMGQELGHMRGLMSLRLQKYLADQAQGNYEETQNAFPLGDVISGGASAALLTGKLLGLF